MAATIRILVHDTKKSKSVLHQLGRKNVEFLDTALDPKPDNPFFQSGLTIVQAKVTRAGVSEGKFIPRCHMPDAPHQPKMVSFGEWWGKVVLVEPRRGQRRRGKLTRKQLVLTLANKEGGAHVDPTLDGAYADITRRRSLGVYPLGYGVAQPSGPPQFAAMRQITHEVVQTLSSRPETLDEFPYPAASAGLTRPFPSIAASFSAASL